jgi:hypothetical protein
MEALIRRARGALHTLLSMPAIAVALAIAVESGRRWH